MVNALIEVGFRLRLTPFQLDCQFAAEPGFMVLFGPSGCGKTTALNCIAGLVSPEEGYIRFPHATLFDSVSKLKLPPQKRDVGYVFQRPSLFPHLSVSGNIDFGMKDSESRDRLVEIFKLQELLKRRPIELSGGQAQKVALARALASRPKALLLDEPFNALDLDSRAEVGANLKALSREWAMPILMVTHSPEEARQLADTTILMADGKITATEKNVISDGSGGRTVV